MAGVAKKGTNDADGNGKKGGSNKQDSVEGRLARLEKDNERLRAIMERNGMSFPD